MSVFHRGEQHRRLEGLRRQQEEVGGLSRPSERGASPSSHMEQEKRIRREIANSNERRRMQSINAGFQSLRTLLPHHEGEKLSKAAILQQTAEYIYQLEQEKTSLLSQNCHLKRLLNQHEGQQEASSTAAKKRKVDTSSIVVPVTTVPCESSDEGIGSMSPEPVAAAALAADHSHEMIELRMQLDRERRRRMHAEEQLRTLESQFYPERLRELTQQLHLKYQGVEHVVQPQQGSGGLVSVSLPVLQETQLQVVSAASLPPVARTTTIPSCSRSPSPDPMPASPPAPLPPRSPSPEPQRLPPALEAAIKAEPKVEVERLPSPSPSPDNVSPQGSCRLYLPSTSRQNLETIVEAIRHLEGDHLFSDDPSPTQEAPLALTTSNRAAAAVKVEMEPFLQFHPHPITPAAVAALQQQRPGVIVVKQNT